MAEEEKDKDLEMEEDGGGKSKKLLIIIIVAVLLVGGGVAAFFLMGSDPAPEAEATAQVEEQAAAESKNTADLGSALYVAMPRPFVFNVPGSSRERLVEIKVQLMVRGDASEEMAKRHIPLIEGTLLTTFSRTNADDLSTMAGKEALKTKALQDVQVAMNDVAGQRIVEKVLFTGFVMQ